MGDEPKWSIILGAEATWFWLPEVSSYDEHSYFFFDICWLCFRAGWAWRRK
jgi:hypothetical protein